MPGSIEVDAAPATRSREEVSAAGIVFPLLRRSILQSEDERMRDPIEGDCECCSACPALRQAYGQALSFCTPDAPLAIAANCSYSRP